MFRLDSVVLIPIGSVKESICGITHLFEHLLITELESYQCYAEGHTTEDYIMLYGININHSIFLKALQNMDFNCRSITRQKKSIMEEVRSCKRKPEENFFKKVWRNTQYAKSPLGTIQGITQITKCDLQNMQKAITKMPFFFYTRDRGVVRFFNGGEKEYTLQDKPTQRIIIYRNKRYNVLYTDSNIELWYLLLRCIQYVNPKKQIQLSEKKYMSALILEEGCVIPSATAITPHIGSILERISNDVGAIKAYTIDLAINELESMYFYNKTWQQRIDTLRNYRTSALVRLADKVNEVIV